MSEENSIFKSEEFQNGFIEFCSSAQYEKYMKPMLNEMIEVCRTKLETTNEFVKWQSRLSAIRQIDGMALKLRLGKSISANNVSAD